MPITRLTLLVFVVDAAAEDEGVAWRGGIQGILDCWKFPAAVRIEVVCGGKSRLCQQENQQDYSHFASHAILTFRVLMRRIQDERTSATTVRIAQAHELT